MVHNNFKQLELLIDLLNDSCNNIFLHIDKKLKILPKLETKHADLICLKQRIDIH